MGVATVATKVEETMIDTEVLTVVTVAVGVSEGIID